MNCNQVASLVSAYADDEVDPLRHHAITRHLHGCRGCHARLDAIVALRARVGAEAPYFVASPAFKARVHAMANAMAMSTPRRARPTGDRWRWLGGGVLAGCAASMFAWVVSTAVITAQSSDEFAIAAVASHVRATRSARLIEVASSDRHTVKPWLSARLDYSPPVHDFADEGFALIGGRIDRLDHRPVATLVYGYREHTIDVFVRPELPRARFAALHIIEGLNVARATGPTMEWLAVSDVEPAVLTEFVQRLAHEEGSN